MNDSRVLISKTKLGHPGPVRKEASHKKSVTEITHLTIHIALLFIAGIQPAKSFTAHTEIFSDVFFWYSLQ